MKQTLLNIVIKKAEEPSRHKCITKTRLFKYIEHFTAKS